MFVMQTTVSKKGIRLCYLNSFQEGFNNKLQTITISTELKGKPQSRNTYRFSSCTFSESAVHAVTRLRGMNSMRIIAGNGAGLRVVDHEGVSMFTAKSCVDLTPSRFIFKLPTLAVTKMGDKA